MPKPRQPSRPAEPPPPRRTAMRWATAERKLRILERLTSGASIAHVAHAENLTTRRAPQFTAEILPTRDVDPPAGFVPLQIARLGDAMRIAHTKTREVATCRRRTGSSSSSANATRSRLRPG